MDVDEGCKQEDRFVRLWCQRRNLCVHYSHHISNCEIRNRTGCTPATDIICCRRLQLFCHIARSEPEMYHCRALRAAIRGPPADWKLPRGRPRQTSTRTVENDLKPANVGLHTAWRRAQDRAERRNFVTTATLHYRGMLLMMMMIMMNINVKNLVV